MLKTSRAIVLLLLAIPMALTAQTTFSVTVVGKGRPMILIHGLYSSGEVWNETVEHYRDRYECHVLTLAGFGGNKSITIENLLDAVKNDLISYVKNKKLEKPVLVGHSMGGFIALWTAGDSPKDFSRVISVDGLPFLAAIRMPDAPQDSVKATAKSMRARMSIQKKKEDFIISQRQTLPALVSDSVNVEKLLKISLQADVGIQAQVMYEMFYTDLRKMVSAIDCPVLLLGSWIAGKNYGATHKGLLRSYQAQVANIKDVRIEISDTAKHFIFYDDPQWFYAKVDEFLHN